MAILDRFSDIISANVNALIDRMEDPEKMIDQYLRKMMDDLAEVKQNTASVMAEETRAKRLVDENEAEVAKYGNFARKALEAGNDGDARVFFPRSRNWKILVQDSLMPMQKHMRMQPRCVRCVTNWPLI